MQNNNHDYIRRVTEELRRISDSPAELGRRLGVTTQTASYWLSGRNLPSIGGLEIMHRAGLDVLYVITGARILQDIPHTCETCAHYCDGDLAICDEYDYDCARCPNSDTCRTCRSSSNWRWRHK